MITQKELEEIFSEKSIFINGRNVLPYEVALETVTMDAIHFASHVGAGKPHWTNTENANGYGIGDYTLMYLTKSGFEKAVSFMNISEYRDHIKRDKINEWTEFVNVD